MEEILYVILGIVWLVVSVINSNKKKKKEAERKKAASQPSSQAKPSQTSGPVAQSPSPEEVEDDSIDFEEMLEEFFGADKPKPKPQPQASTSNETSAHSRSIEENRRNTTPEPSFNSQKPGSVKEAIPERELEKYQGKMEEKEYEFAAEGKVETIEDLINTYDKRSAMYEKENSELRVVDLDDENSDLTEEWEFDAKKAFIYSEIINRKYA